MSQLANPAASLVSRTTAADFALALANAIIEYRLAFYAYKDAKFDKNTTTFIVDELYGVLKAAQLRVEEAEADLRSTCYAVAREISPNPFA